MYEHLKVEVVQESVAPYVQKRLARMEGLWGSSEFSKIDLVLRDSLGQLVAGLRAERRWTGVKLDYLFVDAEHRGRGLGRHLVRELERRAHLFGCKFVRLETSADDAPGFYRALGYHEYAKLEGWPRGHRVVLLHRQLGLTTCEASPLPAEIVLSDEPTDKEVSRVEELLDAFTETEAGPPEFQAYSVNLTDGSSIAGRAGGMHWSKALVISYFEVEEQHRRCGCGQKLLAFLENSARSQELDRIVCWTFSPESGFFLQNGFEKVASLGGYPKSGAAEVLHLQL